MVSLVDCSWAGQDSLKHHHQLRAYPLQTPLPPLTVNMWINGAGFIARGPVFIFSAECLRVLMYVDFISDEWLFDCSFCLRFMALSLSPDCSATLIFNKRDEDINQVLLAALTKTLNVLYGVSKHASHPSHNRERVREGGRGTERGKQGREKKNPHYIYHNFTSAVFEAMYHEPIKCITTVHKFNWFVAGVANSLSTF